MMLSLLSSLVLMLGAYELMTSYGSEVVGDWKNRSTLYFFGFTIMWISSGFYFINFLRSLQKIEERRKMAIQNAKLASLGEMASGIAHEINNPLAVISTRAMQLHRQIERGQYEAEAFKESLIKINTTVNRIAKIIRGLKSFSRNEDYASLAPVSLNVIVEQAIEFCSEKFRHQLIILKVDPVPDLLIDCREDQLVQVILNMLNNSFEAVEKLEKRWVQLSFLMSKNQILSIVITDSGLGIPEKIASRIMQPFFTTKEIGKGTGLGLSVSKGIIENHKGKLYLDPTSYHTRFVIEMPARSKLLQKAA